MSTIAFKDGVLAGDTLTHCGGVRYRTASKVGVGSDAKGPFLAAAVGEAALCDRFLAWATGPGARSGGEPPAMKDAEAEKASGFLFRPDGWIEEHQPGGTVLRFKPYAGCFAAGSGCDFALGAMKAGATAAMATKIAMELDTRSGGDVDVAEFGDPRPVRIAQPRSEPRIKAKRKKARVR